VYQPMVTKVMTALPALFEHASPASLVAGVIYEAATDGTDQLRYTAGEDAAMYISSRHQLDDASYIQGMKSQFGL
jgi:hypothetical protein